jgi:hypothetical protein
MKSFLALAAAALFFTTSLEGQTSPFKDPEDGAFDVGGWISTRTRTLSSGSDSPPLALWSH